MKKIGIYIRSIRVQKNLSSLAMSEILEISVSSYNAYENGSARLVHPNFFRIAEIFKIKPEILFADALRNDGKNHEIEQVGNVAENSTYYGYTLSQLRKELEMKTEMIGALKYQLSKYEGIKKNDKSA